MLMMNSQFHTFSLVGYYQGWVNFLPSFLPRERWSSGLGLVCHCVWLNFAISECFDDFVSGTNSPGCFVDGPIGTYCVSFVETSQDCASVQTSLVFGLRFVLVDARVLDMDASVVLSAFKAAWIFKEWQHAVLRKGQMLSNQHYYQVLLPCSSFATILRMAASSE